MSHRSKLIIAGLTAAVTMAFGVSTASAAHLSVSHGRLFRAVFSPLRFNEPFGGEIAICRVTLEGSFHSATIAKVERALIGHITHASVASVCERGRATVLLETLPWHIQYGGFVGRLPQIEGIRLRLIGASFRLGEVPIVGSCLSHTEENRPAVGIAQAGEYEGGGNGRILSLKAEENPRIPCGGIEGSFAGSAPVSEPGTGERLLIRLI